MDNLGAIGGPLLALALVALVGVRSAILLSIVPGLLAAVAIVIAIRSAPKLGVRERRPLRVQVCPVLRGGLSRLFIGVRPPGRDAGQLEPAHHRRHREEPPHHLLRGAAQSSAKTMKGLPFSMTKVASSAPLPSPTFLTA
jgi:MFS family permease